ncbi:MAG: hypothetical protein HQK54_10610 [Oligoflexales bacterium]|nr:hypothetical protein [Oligoflexales bacterium]
MRKWLAAIASVALFSVIAWSVRLFYHPDLQALVDSVKPLLEYPRDLFPEPVERMIFNLAVILIPIFLLFFHYLIIHLPWQKGLAKSGFVLFILLFFYSIWNSIERFNLQFYLNTSFVKWHPVIYFLLVFPLFLFLVIVFAFSFPSGRPSYARKSSRVLRFFDKMTSFAANRFVLYFLDAWVIILILGAFLISIFGKGFPYATHFHFAAVFHPVHSVWSGKALLVNAISQYGLYPQFLEPVFRVIGLDVARFTLVMGLLVTVRYLFVFFSYETHY